MFELASRNNRIPALETNFDNIVHKVEEHINTLRADAESKANEFNEDKDGEV